MTIKEIKDEEFETEVINSTDLVLVDFWAPWCGPCRMLAPTLEEISESKINNFKIVKVNIDDNPEKASEFKIRAVPTLLLFKEGKIVATKSGMHDKDTLESWITENSK